jgi:AcrR family transcriptional regulator
MVRTMSPRIYSSARDRILDAAEAVLLRDGLGGLSVDAVVRAAKASKGAFFHHFASKEAMLTALIERLTAQVGAQIAARAARDRGRRGGSLRAQCEVLFAMPAVERRRLQALVMSVVLAAIESKPIAARIRASNRKGVADAVAEGVPVGRALVVHAALDGFWLGETLGTTVLTRRERAAVRDTLLALVEEEP